MTRTPHHLTTTALFGLFCAVAPVRVVFAQDDGAATEGTATGDSDTAAAGQDTEVAQTPEENKKKLSDRIKSVQRKAFVKNQRVEIFPQFALDLNDPFYQHMIVGGAVGFHLADSFSLEARGGVVIGSVEQSAIKFVRVETGSLIEDPPEFKYHFDADALWAPFYGKISLFGEGILHFDTYLTAGAGVFGTDAGVNPAANIGIGQRYFITEWLVARVELRNYLFLDNRGDSADLQNLMVLGFAVSGFFPTTFEYEFQ
jgi:outer membrane beta-barrel protein